MKYHASGLHKRKWHATGCRVQGAVSAGSGTPLPLDAHLCMEHPSCWAVLFVANACSWVLVYHRAHVLSHLLVQQCLIPCTPKFVLQTHW